MEMIEAISSSDTFEIVTIGPMGYRAGKGQDKVSKGDLKWREKMQIRGQ